jgi:hypothetical protein
MPSFARKSRVAVEQPHAAAQENGYDVQLQFVEQSELDHLHRSVERRCFTPRHFATIVASVMRRVLLNVDQPALRARKAPRLSSNPPVPCSRPSTVSRPSK